MSVGAIARPVTSTLRSWSYLVSLSFRRHGWSWQVAIVLAIIGLFGVITAIDSIWNTWTVVRFTKAVILNFYLGFMLPMLCLTFGTNALGGDWEERSLVWLLTRPLPRPLIYLAKFLAVLPWTFGLTLGSLILLGVISGLDGMEAVWRFWPAVAWGTLAYVSLFVLMGAWFRRSTIITVVYSFVFEVIVGNMPGLVKRASIGFYSRCLVYDQNVRGVSPDKRDMFLPVDGATALNVLLIASVVFIVLGIVVFSRRQYHDLT